MQVRCNIRPCESCNPTYAKAKRMAVAQPQRPTFSTARSATLIAATRRSCTPSRCALQSRPCTQTVRYTKSVTKTLKVKTCDGPENVQHGCRCMSNVRSGTRMRRAGAPRVVRRLCSVALRTRAPVHPAKLPSPPPRIMPRMATAKRRQLTLLHLQQPTPAHDVKDDTFVDGGHTPASPKPASSRYCGS